MFIDNHASIKFDNRESMIAYLKNHFRYGTMNSWNKSTSYANNVKLYNLNIPKDLYEKAYDVVCNEIQNEKFDIDYRMLVHEFHVKTGYYIGYNGRSAGYLVMFETKPDGNKGYKMFPGRSIDMYEDFEEWDIQEICERCKLVMEFDKTCEAIRKAFIESLKAEIIEETIYIPKTVKYLK